MIKEKVLNSLKESNIDEEPGLIKTADGMKEPEEAAKMIKRNEQITKNLKQKCHQYCR